jgi:hypothetical protein
VLLKAGAEVGTIITSTSIGIGGKGSYTWDINPSGATGSEYKVKISGINQPTVSDTSNNYFTLSPAGTTAPTITVTSPNGGETWERGTTHVIRWTYTDFPFGAPVKIVLLKANTEIATIVASTSIGAFGGEGSYTWDINPSGATGSEFKVRVQSLSQPTVKDTSNAVFTLSPAVTAPTGAMHFGVWEKISANQALGVYASPKLAETDGFVKLVCKGSKEQLILGAIGTYPTSNVLAIDYSPLIPSENSAIASFIMPVQKGQMWIVQFHGGCDKYFNLEWLPIE